MGAFVLPAIALVVAVTAPPASAHVAATAVGGDSPAWTVILAMLLGGSAALYGVGVTRLWRRAGVGRGVRRGDALRFGLAWIVLTGSLLSPIDALAVRSFALHMLQHELMMLVAAPLFALSRPLEAWTWALAPVVRRGAAAIVRDGRTKRAWQAVTRQSSAWCVHAMVLWIWHVPVLFVAAEANPSLHIVQHACFFASALLFWWSVLRVRGGLHGPGALASLVTTMLHTSALGALLALAPHPLYVAQSQIPVGGLTVLEDQQLGGLIMWVPGSVAYLVAALVIVAGWLAAPRARHDVA